MKDKMRELARVFKALSDTNRLRILKMLEVRPLCVCEMTEILGLAPSTVSRHLTILRDAGFIIDEKEGKWVNYRLNQSSRQDYVKALIPLLSRWLPDDETIRRDRELVNRLDRHILCTRVDS